MVTEQVNVVPFNLDFNGVLQVASQQLVFLPLAESRFCYINRISGYNNAANTYNGIVGIIDSGGNYVPISITACAQNAAFNTQIDKTIIPTLGAYWQFTATSYPVTPQAMIDGYYYDIVESE
ncbi:MAG: hypothetical protein ABSB40_12810 [Nitrososphaeria archaeon]|jgi:hypothetical protein